MLRIPGPIGALTKKTLGNFIDNAFEELNTGIKVEAEHAISR